MADIKLIRAKEELVPVHSDGQLIFTDEGNIYTDFPNEQRIAITGMPQDNIINQLAYYNPDKIDMEYTHTAGGWKIAIKDNDTEEELPNISRFPSHKVADWETHTITFDNNNTSSATFQIYSVHETPGVIDVDDISLTCPALPDEIKWDEYFPDPTLQDDTIWSTKAKYISFSTEGITIDTGTTKSWSTYLDATLDVISNQEIRVEIELTDVVSGGINYKILDDSSSGTQLAKGYWSSASPITCIITPTTNKLYIKFSGSGNYVDKLNIKKISIKPTNMYIQMEEGLRAAWLSGNNGWGVNSIMDTAIVAAFQTTEATKQSWLSISRGFKFNSNQLYKIEFETQTISQGFNISLKSENDIILGNKTFSAQHSQDWIKYQYYFFPHLLDETYNFKISAWGTQATGITEAYIKNLQIVPITNNENLILNGQFDEDLVVNQTNYPGKANWFFGTASTVIDGVARLATPEDNTSKYVPGCSQTIVLLPHAQHQLTVKTKSVSSIPAWKPYITFTPEDKIGFVSNLSGYEVLKFGGPWANATTPWYAARVTVQSTSDHPVNIENLRFWATIETTSTLFVKITWLNNGIITNETVSSLQVNGNLQLLSLPLRGILEENTVLMLTFYTETQDHEGSNQIHHLGLYAKANNLTDYYTIQPYQIDANRNIILPKNLVAKQIKATIDDGSISWEDLTR